MNVSPNILAKKYNFKNLRRGFVDERALITSTSIFSCHWNNPAPFILWKKTPENPFFNTNSELLQNCTEKQIMPLKTTIIGYLTVYDVIRSLLVLIEKLAFFNKQL